MPASQTQLVPAQEMAPGQISAIRNKAIANVLTMVSTKLNLSQDRLVVRGVRADLDLDYGVEDWAETTGATADAYETMTTGTIASQTWWCIYGVLVDFARLNCSFLKFNIGGADRALWPLQELYPEAGGDHTYAVGICPSCLIVPENTPYTISRYVRNASSPSFIMLKSFIVEPRGLLVSP
jgi:hypothetical protein